MSDPRDIRLTELLGILSEVSEPAVFNPWFEYDPEYDASQQAPEIRRLQLRQYLAERFRSAEFLLIAEALGYQGGHFTGIAMTSERILLGHKSREGPRPSDVFRGRTPLRTSKPSVKSRGFSENTATIVWKTLHSLNLDPYRVVLWNVFPWHPFDPKNGMLSNRTPGREEFQRAQSALEQFLRLFPESRVVAVGNHAAEMLESMGNSLIHLRHPAHGGAADVKQGVADLTGKVEE